MKRSRNVPSNSWENQSSGYCAVALCIPHNEMLFGKGLGCEKTATSECTNKGGPAAAPPVGRHPNWCYHTVDAIAETGRILKCEMAVVLSLSFGMSENP